MESTRLRHLTKIQANSICVRNTLLAYNAAIRVRDESIIAAVNDGLSQRKVAEAAVIAPGRVNAIVHRGGEV